MTAMIGIIFLLVLCVFYFLGFFDSNWNTVCIRGESYNVDNREAPFYKEHGFHKYDTMSDIDTYSSTYELQKHRKTGDYRIKHNGYSSPSLEKLISEDLLIFQAKHLELSK